MRIIYQKIRHVRYLYIKRNVEKVWGARYTLGAHYLSKNTVYFLNTTHNVCYTGITNEPFVFNRTHFPDTPQTIFCL